MCESRSPQGERGGSSSAEHILSFTRLAWDNSQVEKEAFSATAWLDPCAAHRQKRRMTDAIESLSFEDALKELESIVARLETGDAALDESIALYTRGEALRGQCEKRLKDAQARIEKITLGPDGTPTGTAPFDES